MAKRPNFLNLTEEDRQDANKLDYKKKLFSYIDSLSVKPLTFALAICDYDIDLTDPAQYSTTVAFIEGTATGGSISFNGSSAVRRSGSISLLVKEGENPFLSAVTDKEYSNLLLNKKIEISVGIENTGYQYLEEYEYFWFSLGMFLIKNAQVTNNNSGVILSLTLTDLMGFLNGEIGGVINGETKHSPINVETIDPKTGKIETDEQPVRYYTLIKSLVQTYTGLPDEKIIIKIPIDKEQGTFETEEGEDYKFPAQWQGVETVYVNDVNDQISKNNIGGTPYQQYEVIGYKRDKLTYQGQLISKGGDTVVSVLDKIKNALGNFEYFFDT